MTLLFFCYFIFLITLIINLMKYFKFNKLILHFTEYNQTPITELSVPFKKQKALEG